MIYFITLGLGIIFLILFRIWRNNQLRSVYQNEISHFSNIGFSDMMTETEIQIWLQRAKKEGIQRGNWILLEGNGEQLWIADPDSKQYEIQPFFKGQKHEIHCESVNKLNENEGFAQFKINDRYSVLAEIIPFEENSRNLVYLTAFGVMPTLYDSENQYENIVKSKFKKQVVSLAIINHDPNNSKVNPSAEIILSGIIAEHERKVNQFTQNVYWHVLIDVGNDVILDTVWDYRLADRFPQRGNVIVGNFYLFGSYQMERVS